MGYFELLRKVQDYSGFSATEANDALQLMVESLAVHLSEPERKDFANQLPEELQDIALSVYATDSNSKQDILQQFMVLQHIDERRAKKQIRASWRALREAMARNEVDDIKSQLKNQKLLMQE